MVVFILLVVGLVFGSFVNALVWRLYKQSHLKNKKSKERYSIVEGRSICPNCSHELAPIDLIPVVSWLLLKGKCRYCHKPISIQYPLVELLTALLFIFSYLFWPSGFHGHGLFEFVLWLGFIVGFVALGVYDFRWKILPNRITYLLAVIAILQVIILATVFHSGLETLIKAFWGEVIIAGLFYVLFEVSREQWIGGGDVKLGITLGALAGGFEQAIMVIFFASFLGSLYGVPLLMRQKGKKGSPHIPFGPFLLISMVVVRLFGAVLLNHYRQFIGQ